MVEKAKKIVVGCAIALAFFALVEGILWGAGVVPVYQRSDPYVGFAGWSPLFVERATPTGKKVYETSPSKLQWFNPQRFPARKEVGVTRVFCLGGSTTYGRPYDDRTSFCGWLREFLPAVDPGRRWEVINAGGISYASYRVVRLMDALTRFDPDLFVVYTGHNEFLEKRTYSRLLNTPEIVRDLGSLASRLRLYSVLSDIAYDRSDVLATNVEALLDRSVGPEDYHRDDAMRDAVLEHFRTSLDRMTRISERAGARTIFVTPASNIRDFSPFKAESSTRLTAEEVQRVLDMTFAAQTALDQGDPARAVAITEEALTLDPRNADLLFLKGRALHAEGHTEKSRRAFIAARDEDVAPLRALTPIRQIVADVADESDAGLVDFASIVYERSPDGIPGSELFLDHVHPTIEGNRILALALIDNMIQEGMVSPTATWNEAAIADISKRVESGVDEAANELARKSLANVLIWAGKHEEAERLVDFAVETKSTDGEIQFQKATLLRRAGRNQEALPFYAEAVRLSPWNAAARKGYGILLSELGRKAEARTQLEEAARLDQSLPTVHYDLGVVLGELGENEQAEAAYRLALQHEPDNADANNNLGILLAMRGELAAAAERFSRAVSADPGHKNAIDNLARARAMMKR